MYAEFCNSIAAFTFDQYSYVPKDKNALSQAFKNTLEKLGFPKGRPLSVGNNMSIEFMNPG